MSDPHESHGVLLTVAYDGAPFAGFAAQPGHRTVAGELLGALSELDPSIGSLRGASRTDAGVHARGQRVAFEAQARIPPRGWVLGPVRHLPAAISIRAAARVPPGFDPRFEAKAKTYRYLLLCSPTADPLLAGRAWRVDGLDRDDALALLQRELGAARGTHDFAAFRSARDERAITVRTITGAAVAPHPSHRQVVAVDITGDGFLHRMVRILVGTAVDAARGRLQAGAIARALASGERRDAGITAPPDGLCLQAIELAYEGEDRWPP